VLEDYEDEEEEDRDNGEDDEEDIDSKLNTTRLLNRLILRSLFEIYLPKQHLIICELDQ